MIYYEAVPKNCVMLNSERTSTAQFASPMPPVGRGMCFCAKAQNIKKLPPWVVAPSMMVRRGPIQSLMSPGIQVKKPQQKHATEMVSSLSWGRLN